MKLLIIIALFCCTQRSCGKAVHIILPAHDTYNNQSTIIKGSPVSIEAYPFMSHLTIIYVTKRSICGSTILKTTALLTAAHCFMMGTVQAVKVSVGSATPEYGVFYYASNYTTHSSFRPPRSDNDIAVVKMAEPIHLDFVVTTTVVLSKTEALVNAGTTLEVVGWGQISVHHGKAIRLSLRSGDNTVVSSASCQANYGTKEVITKRMFCAGSTKDGSNTCYGDSGGPALTKKEAVQVGIISSGINCGRPTIFTNVAAMHEWIEGVIGA